VIGNRKTEGIRRQLPDKIMPRVLRPLPLAPKYHIIISDGNRFESHPEWNASKINLDDATRISHTGRTQLHDMRIVNFRRKYLGMIANARTTWSRGKENEDGVCGDGSEVIDRLALHGFVLVIRLSSPSCCKPVKTAGAGLYQAQILSRESHDPVHRLIPSLLTPRQLTRFSCPLSDPTLSPRSVSQTLHSKSS